MSEWTQELQDYWKAHCQDNSWKNVPLSVPQKSMLAFIEHIELITTLCNYWEDTAKNNKTLENELLMCRHAAKTFTKLHDEKCRKIDELQSTITQQADLIRRLREMCGWMLKYGEVTWKPMSDSEPRFMESLRTLMNELEKSRCKTCGGQGEVYWKYDDQNIGAQCDAKAPCPDCNGGKND
jgi:hypothetical protein